MKHSKTKTIIVLLVLAMVFSVSAQADEPPKADLPVLTTSAGQSSGAVIINALSDRIGLKYDYCDVPTGEQVAAGVGLGDFKEGVGHHLSSKSGAAKGTPYKTIVIAVGASLKGMGASGLSIDGEIARMKKVLEACKKNGIMVVMVHVEGKSRRGKPGSDNELIIDAVAPYADYIVVTEDGNFDGRFTDIAKKSHARISVIKNSSELTTILQKLFLSK